MNSQQSLYFVHDADYSYRVVVRAKDGDEAISKLKAWMQETKQNGELWSSANVKWYADLCDNDKIII